MRKLLFLILFLAVIGYAAESYRGMEPSAPGSVPPAAIVMPPQPTLILRLEEPAVILSKEGKALDVSEIEKEVAKSPTPQPEGSALSRFEISADEKRHPILSYKFVEKSEAAKEADSRAPRELPK